ncbi:MAG: hypothetical protein JRN15_02620 [Nitrososphaerota archaeon]|nr:hypothetical protein [Nitrososphaerota archaeon]
MAARQSEINKMILEKIKASDVEVRDFLLEILSYENWASNQEDPTLRFKEDYQKLIQKYARGESEKE